MKIKFVKKTTKKSKSNGKRLVDKKGFRILKYTTFSFIFCTAIFLHLLLINYFYFQDRFSLNTRVGDIEISGLKFSEAKKLVDEQILNYFEQPIFLQINNETAKIYAGEIELKIEYLNELREIFQKQHPDEDSTKGLFTSLLRHFNKTQKSFFVSFKTDRLTEAAYHKFDNFEPFSDPEINFVNGQFEIVPGKNGQEITFGSLENLKKHFSYLKRDNFFLDTQFTYPKISDESAQIVAEKSNEIIQKNLILKAGNVQLVEKLANHPEWLEFELTSEDRENALFTQPIYFKFGLGIVAGESTGPALSLLLNPEELEYFVSKNIVSRLSNHSENIYLTLDQNGTIQVEGTLKNGYALDTKKAVNLIVDNFNNNIFENELPISIQAGRIIDRTGIGLEIIELLAVGESDFSGSDSNRVNNVKTGLSKFQNIIIPPGGIFNYADYIGLVDAAHGFLPGWVIKNRNQLAREYGGGICQTSTTLFRAAFYAGLPILERHQHGYDVSYYRWPAVGLDASVYVPYASLKFKNDTPGHILIQQEVNTATNRAYVWIYGTKDGREVKVTGPEIYNKYWPSSSITQTSPNLAPGEKKLTHGAVAGFQSDWWRQVLYSDGRVENYNVHSSYAAVPATYLTGE